MPATLGSRRSLQDFVALLVSAVLSLIATYHDFTELQQQSSQGILISHESTIEESQISDETAHRARHGTLNLGDLAGNANSSSRLVKRIEEANFQRYKDPGDTALAAIERSVVHNVLYGCEPPIQDFDPEALANGWSRKDSNAVSPEVWEETFGQILGENRKPTVGQSFVVELTQNKPFTNAVGQHVEQFEERAMYKQGFIPSLSAIVVQNIRSPSNQIKLRFERARQPAPSSQEIATRYVPPLNHWSDVAWTLWKQKAGNSNAANNLRYIAYDFVTNAGTRDVMGYLFENVARRLYNPFPGLEFGMDSNEGRALLGTPLGIGFARVLADRATGLGRREPRVRIFTKDGWYFCMLWDLRRKST
ncbi:MAG: hypothetical protein Q9188_004354 [Gyalolechia gomerana]